jgi:hypothetical protein
MKLLPAERVQPNGLSVRITIANNRVNIQVFQHGLQEQFNDFVVDPDSDRYLPFALLTQSQFIRVRLLSWLPDLTLTPAGTFSQANGELVYCIRRPYGVVGSIPGDNL